MKTIPCLLLVLLASSTPPAGADEVLKKALVMHASFDKGFDADFSRGDASCYLKAGSDLLPCVESDDLKRVEGAGRFGSALWFPRKGTVRPTFRGEGVLGYNAENWSATVSAWLRLSPDEDLEPGYCDPIQIVGNDTKKGFIFLEWSKDHQPRYFRYAIRPLIELWDPKGLGWEGIPDAERPMVQLSKTPFSRDRWTHAVFTLDQINRGKDHSSGVLYLDGKREGVIKNHDLTFGWDPKGVMLVLGAAYVGHLDDLSVFDRALSDGEVARLFALEKGVAGLHP